MMFSARFLRTYSVVALTILLKTRKRSPLLSLPRSSGSRCSISSIRSRSISLVSWLMASWRIRS